MNDVNELWSSPWRKLHENLASGARLESTGQMQGSGQKVSTDESRFPGASAVSGRMVPSTSWLVRARSRKARVARIIQ
jgi:hypothetical protein